MMADSTQTKNRRSAAEEDGRPVEDEEQEERDEEPRAEERKDPDREEDDRGDRPGTRLTAKELAEAAISTIADLTGLAPESVTALQWDGESWLVTVDVLELARIPNTTDVLASYVVQLDDSGELLGYKRTRRFLRGQVESD
jgi:Gas vesicle synthesis protein GvpO